MKPTQIIFLVNDIHFNGGGERVTVNMSNWFVANGYKVIILSMSPRSPNKTFLLKKDVEIKYLGVNNSRYLSKIKTSKRLSNYLKTCQENSLIFGIGTYANVLLGLVKPKKIFTIACEHNAFNSVSKFWKICRSFTYKNHNACVVLTSSDIVDMKKLNNNSFVIPNSTPSVKISANLMNKKFIAIGRLSYQKAFDKMINIFEKFSQFNKDWCLEIYGEGSEKEHLKNLINKLKLDNRIKIYNFSNEISNIYLNASVLLLTSRYEGLPMVLLEAQSYGLPMICFDCDTGPRDVVINERNGYLIEENNNDLFVKAMLQLSNNETLRKQMGINSKEDSYRFTEDTIFQKWNNLIQSL